MGDTFNSTSFAVATSQQKTGGHGSNPAPNADAKGKPSTERKKDLRDCAIIRFKGSNADKIDSQFFKKYEKVNNRTGEDDEFNFDIEEYNKQVAEDIYDDGKVQVYSHSAFS